MAKKKTKEADLNAAIAKYIGAMVERIAYQQLQHMDREHALRVIRKGDWLSFPTSHGRVSFRMSDLEKRRRRR